MVEVMVSVPECLCLNNDAGLVAEGQPDEDGEAPVILDPVKMEVVSADLILRDEQGEQSELPMGPDELQSPLGCFTNATQPFTIFTFQCPRCNSAVIIGRGTDVLLEDLL